METTRRLAIFRINFKSDFVLTLQSDAGWNIPFCIKFWTSVPTRAYYAGWDGTTYTHCAPVAGDSSKLQVQFDDHNLPIGELKYQIGYHFTVDDFPDNPEDEVINQEAVIIDNNGRNEKVLLDFNGETAPDIQFSLPAYANESQRIANEEQRIENEQTRISNEETRIVHEWERQRNEQTRIAQEEARERAFTQMQRDSESATSAANNAAALANSKARLAQEKAEYAQQQGDFAKAQGETAQLDHTKAAADHQTALADHQTAAADHQTALADHQTAAADHQTAESDHTRAGQDHTDIQNAIAAADLVFDISKAHASGGVLATYADLSAALGTNGANVPVERRQGGMTVQFVRTSDNKYLQFMYKLEYANTTAGNTAFVNTANWEKINLEDEVKLLDKEKMSAEELEGMDIITLDELEYSSSAANLLKNDGTLSNHPSLHHYKYLIPEGVKKVYLSGSFNLNPTSGYSLFWLVTNNTMLYYEPITSIPQTVSNKEIVVGSATEIWVNDNNSAQLTYYKSNAVTPEELEGATDKLVSYDEQSLTDEEKEQARENIDAIGTRDAYPNMLNITDPNGYIVASFDSSGKLIVKNDRLYALMNKKTVCFGDSVTKGSWLNFIKYNGSGSEDMSYIISHRWTQQLKEYFEWEMGTPNPSTGVGGGFQGYSGYPLSNARLIGNSCIIYKMEDYFSDSTNVNTPPDIVILWGGHNDVGYYAGDVLQAASPLGDFNDGPTLSDRLIETNAKVGTFCGALRYATELVEHFAPNAQMYVLTPLLTQQVTWETQMKDESDGVHYVKDMAYSIISGADTFGYTFIQMGGCGIDSQNGVAGFFTADGLHPNIAGTDLIVNYLKNILKSK